MLFNSHLFIFLFLPTTLFIFILLTHHHYKISLAWLIIASLFFYAWWNPVYLILLIASILGNYTLGQFLNYYQNQLIGKLALILGLTANLALLVYYKYANFFIDNVNGLFGSSYHLEMILLPLAISFFTFQQIAYLVDSYRGQTQQYSFLHYSLFVTFFPQLIAGPIVYHREMLPQFNKPALGHKQLENINIGLTLFVIGLFKKVVLADNMALYATPVFDAAEQGRALGFFEAWQGTLAYTLQLYFDFSGYSDMAVGLARMFGIVLPINFYSPYKASNIIAFWHRWHITLSRFLRDYLYIPLGGNRKGGARRFFNLIFTMCLGGLWHGAGWTFVLWGLLHGVYLVINHLWQSVCQRLPIDKMRHRFWWRVFATILTFLAVSMAWVLFRSESLEGAMLIYYGLINFDSARMSLLNIEAWIGIGILLIIVWLMPNAYQVMSSFKPVLLTYEKMKIQATWLRWRPSRKWAATYAVMGALAILSLTRVSEFLYFQF
jgi:alginate O-acetyltransferase complex protein AlgI